MDADQTGWDNVLGAADAKDEERKRCLSLVRAEISAGLARGVPMTAGVMVILHRLESAIERG